jgi:signal transduction histidine kinase
LIEDKASTAIPLPAGVFKEFNGPGHILLAAAFEHGGTEGISFQILDGKAVFSDLASARRFTGMDLQLSSVLDLSDGSEITLTTSISEHDDMSEDTDLLISAHSFHFGNQGWNAVSWSTEDVFKVDHFRVQVALLVSITLTALVYYIVWSQLERTRRVSSIVDRRTRALKKANDELAEHYEVLQELNTDLSKARESAEAASRAKSEFLATMSHELRTPLNAILGFSQILKDQVVGPLGDERYVEYSHDIHASGSHLLGLINDILDLAKLEANQLKIENHEVYPSDLLDSIKPLITPKFREKDVALSLSLSDEMPQLIVGDDLRLKQIIINLVSNAIKFTDEGSIDVEIYPKPLTDTHKPGYMIEVRDTGIGIPEDKQSLLFQRFTQIDAALTRKHGGVGLGLAICYELASKMNGTISVESKEGAGTVFFVHLPLEEVDMADTDDSMMI